MMMRSYNILWLLCGKHDTSFSSKPHFHWRAFICQFGEMEAAALRPNFPATCSTSTFKSALPLPTAAGVGFLVPKSVRITSSFKIARASNPKSDQPNSSTDEPALPFLTQEDLSFLGKLGAGSIGGGAAIKYGSVIFPEITTPNITLALFMISAPVIVAVVLLFNQTRADSNK